jgi:predicted nucleic acid-binding protein
MPNLVIDSSVAIKWFLPEQYTAEARRILDGYQRGDLTLLAPELIYAEVGNIVWKKQQFHHLAEADAQQIITEFQALVLITIPSVRLLNDAYRLAIAHRRTVYDSLYLALSVQEQCPFVTADERFVNAISTSFPNIIWLANWS